MKTGLRRSKPPQAEHEVWKYYELYVKAEFSGIAICLLCEEENFGCAGIVYKDGLASNLLGHLDTARPRHREAFEKVANKSVQGLRGGRAGRIP